MAKRGATSHSLTAAALAAGLLPVISSPARVENRLATVPQHIETIQRFIGAINEHRPTDAVAMLGAELVPDAAAKRDWTRHFSAIRSVHVMAIEPSAVAARTPCHEYKVTLEAHVSADPEAVIPSYGWDDNPNYRWIKLCPDQTGAWAISGFGTGP